MRFTKKTYIKPFFEVIQADIDVPMLVTSPTKGTIHDPNTKGEYEESKDPLSSWNEDPFSYTDEDDGF